MPGELAVHSFTRPEGQVLWFTLNFHLPEGGPARAGGQKKGRKQTKRKKKRRASNTVSITKLKQIK